MEIGIDYNILPDDMKDYRNANLVDWNMRLSKLLDDLPEVREQESIFTNEEIKEMTFDLNARKKLTSDGRWNECAGIVVGHVISVEQTIKRLPILLIDDALTHLIEDTVPSTQGLKLPYIGFFINKRFDLRNGSIMGIFVSDRMKFFELYARSIGVPEDKLMDYTAMMNAGNANTKYNSGITFSAIFVNDKELSVFFFDMKEATDYMKDSPKESADVTQRILFYGANVANVITTHVNLSNPIDVKRDVRIVPDRRHAKTAKIKRDYSIIRVFGEMKKYTASYNTQRRRIKSNDSTLVRGHWRYLKSPRYKNKQFQLIWIAPYIKGVAEELRQRLIKLQE